MSEDLFDDSQEFCNYTFLEYKDFVDFLCMNYMGHSEGTTACFQMFYETVENYIYNRSGNIDHEKLNTVESCISKLKKTGAFDRSIFVACLFDTFLTVPLKLIWWLQKNDIFTFAEYCMERKPLNIVNKFVSLYENHCDSEIFANERIIIDILDELICGAYAPRLGICRLARSKIWHDYCKDALNKLAIETVQTALRDTDSLFLSYLKLLNVNHKNKFPQLYKYFFKTILIHLLNTDPEECDLQGVYKYQYLFTSDTLSNNLHIVLNTIFNLLHVNDIFTIVEEHVVNWKYVVYSVSVCLDKRNNDIKILEDTVKVLVNNTFKGGKINELIKAFVFIRQASMNTTIDKSYKTWYSDTFGVNTVLKTGQNATIFKYFMQCLTQLIPREPKEMLHIHIQSSVRTPVHCNSLVFDYKALSRIRLEELKHAVYVKFLGKKIPLIHLIEDCHEKNCITPLMKSVVSQQGDDFKQVVLNHLQDERFSTLKCLYKQMYSIEENVNVTENVNMFNYCMDISDDDSDFT